MSEIPTPTGSAGLHRLLQQSWSALRRRDWSAAATRLMASRRTAAFLLLAFFLTFSSWVFHAAGNEAIDAGSPDENHTLPLGVSLLNPFGKANQTLTVGETTRWFVRLLYPVGLYYQHSHAGGVTSRYYRPTFRQILMEKNYPWNHHQLIQTDPDIQDFVFAMRAAFGLLAAGSFCLALWALYRRVNLAAAVAYGGLALVNETLLAQVKVFYTETTLLILFNLAVFLCFWREMSRRQAAYMGMLAAAALSTKLSGVIIVAPLFAYAAVNMRGVVKFRVEIFTVFFAAALVLIHVNIDSFELLVHRTLLNVFHYKVGHGGFAGPEGLGFFLRILDHAGRLVPLLFLVALAWLARAPRATLVPVYVLGAGIVFLLWSLSNSAWFLSRNVVSPYLAMSFIIALAAGKLVGKAAASRPALKAGATLALLLAFAAGSAHWLTDRMRPAEHIFFTKNKGQLRACKTIAAVGLARDDLLMLRRRATGDIAAFPGIRAPFRLDREKELPEWLLRDMYRERKPSLVVADEYKKFRRHECLVARRTGHTKQITNWFALRDYTLEGRAGNLFFFVKSKKERPASG